MSKVISAGNMFFEDDIKIIDAELDSSLVLPGKLPIFSRDELQVFYNGHIFVASKDPKVDLKDKHVKFYTMIFGLEEIDSPKSQEDKYFADNASAIDKLKQDFIERVVNGLSVYDTSSTARAKIPQLGQELAERIAKKYALIPKPLKQEPAGKGLVGKLEDGSVFNKEVTGYERVINLDGKIYDLFTISEYISKFEKNFDPVFYKKLQEKSKSESPEEISKYIGDNKDKVHRKVLSSVRNKIWYSDRSGRLYLDETYWIPVFRSSANDSVSLYQKYLEEKIKIDGARSLK